MAAWHYAVLALGIVLVACVAGLIVMGTRIMRAGHSAPPGHLDYLIVLGAKVRPDGQPTRALRFRLEATRDYLAEHPATIVIVSGGRGTDEPRSEAATMAHWLEAHGVAREQIICEDTATTTAENLAHSNRLVPELRNARVGIVTNDFHLYRALLTARKQGFYQIWGIPAASTRRNLPKNLARECFALVKNRIQGNL